VGIEKGKMEVIDTAKADVPTVTSVGASLVGVAGVISKARAVGSAQKLSGILITHFTP
jgi:hypothetical protein